MTIKTRLAKLEKEAGLDKRNASYKTVFCLDGEPLEDTCRRLGIPITEKDNPNIFFVQFVGVKD